MTIKFDINQLDDIELGGVDYKDHPDYCDAYLSSATLNGVELTEEELDEINSSDAGASFVNENCYEHVVSSYGY